MPQLLASRRIRSDFKEIDMKYWMALLLALLSASSYAGLTKWVDSEGRVHYSDTPPPDVKSETVRVAPSPGAQPAAAGSAAASAPAGPKTIFEKEADMKKEKKAKEEAEQKAAKKQEEEAQKQKVCSQAREQLVTLQNSPRLVQYDEKGERVYLDDAARQQKISEAQAAVSKYCE